MHTKFRLEERDHFGRPGRKWEDNSLKDIRCESVAWRHGFVCLKIESGVMFL
jgi:hypothetical protein